MGLRLSITSALALAALTAPTFGDDAPAEPATRKVFLQDSAPYNVPIGAVPTTILMPAPIDDFAAAGITTQENTKANAFLQHPQGANYFTVKALLPGPADLNVIIGDDVYSFHFYDSPTPLRSLIVRNPPTPRAQTHAVQVTAKRLYDILQDTKTYFLVRDQHPELERPGVQVIEPGTLIRYQGYSVLLDQIFRFDDDDTLAFRVFFLNATDRAFGYKPSEIGLRIGRNLYWPSFAQVDGVIPPRTPAQLTWAVSPDVQSLTLVSPTHATVTITDRSSLAVPDLGEYRIIARGPKGITDTVTFTIKYPVPAGESDPLNYAKGDRDFGVRHLSIRQPTAGQSFGYVLYTGTADGKRANISLHSQFSLVVAATPLSDPPPAP